MTIFYINLFSNIIINYTTYELYCTILTKLIFYNSISKI